MDINNQLHRSPFWFPMRYAPAFVLCVALVGCSSGDVLHPVTGKVTFKGQPCPGATVMFYPDGPPDLQAAPATAACGDDGSFTLFTGTKGGVKPGKYVVSVVWPDPAKKPTDLQRMGGANPNDAPDVFEGRYAKRDKTPLRAEVKSGENKLEPFDLK